MIGINELILNEATVKEAVQEYLNKRMTTFAPKVMRIVTDSSSSNYCNQFKVTVEQPEDDFTTALKDAYITEQVVTPSWKQPKEEVLAQDADYCAQQSER